jgi:transaldolase
MERALTAGRKLSNLTSVASFFVSRVDTEIDKRWTRSAPRRHKR